MGKSCLLTHLSQQTYTENNACGDVYVYTYRPWVKAERGTTDCTYCLVSVRQHRWKPSACGVNIIFSAIRRKVIAILDIRVTQCRAKLHKQVCTNRFSHAIPHRLINQDHSYLNPQTANRILYWTIPSRCLRVQPSRPHRVPAGVSASGWRLPLASCRPRKLRPARWPAVQKST